MKEETDYEKTTKNIKIKLIGSQKESVCFFSSGDLEKDIEKLDKFKSQKQAIRPRCHKCVEEIGCSKDMDNENKCPKYKRDPKDGGSY